MNLSKIPQIPGLNFPWKISERILEIYWKVSRPFATLWTTETNR